MAGVGGKGVCLIDGRICRTQGEDEWRQGNEPASAKGADLSKGPDSDLDQAHLAYVARAEIKMLILSFPLYSFGAVATLPGQSISLLSTPFLEGEQKLP